MFLLIPVAFVLLVFGLAGATGIGPLVEERRGQRTGLLRIFGPWLAIEIGVAAVLLTVLLVALGIGTGGNDNSPSPRTRAATPSTETSTAASPEEAGSRTSPGATLELSARADDEAFPRSYAVTGELHPDMVLHVRVTGFEPHTAGRVKQCVHGTAVACGNAFPVQFDADGEAFFQYLVLDEFHVNVVHAGGCRADAARCTLVVEDTQRATGAEIDTVFYDDAPSPGTITVHPSSRLVDGQELTVTVFGYPPGVRVNAMLCAAPAATGSRRCGAPGSSAPLVVGPDGTGSTTIVVDDGPVGSQRIECGREVICGISVASDDVFARAPVVPISFARPAGAAYDQKRLASGLGAAVVLVGIAAWFIRRTDWSPVGEAAAPEIDQAQYADLDAIVAALPPEDDHETLVHGP